MADISAASRIGWYLSAYGAALSTLLAILHWRRDRGRFSLSPEVLHIRLNVGTEQLIVWRLIEIVNSGRRPLHLEDFGILLEGEKEESMRDRETDTEYPMKLDEGQKHRSMTVEDRFPSKQIRKLWAMDTTGKKFYSGTYPFGAK